MEYRNGMFNVCPVGRNCTQEERDDFEKYDKEHNIRGNFVEALKKAMDGMNMKFSIGGQISFDVFPVGWDKSYCLQFVEKEYDTIHFFGDKCYDGGNDYEIFLDERTQGHSVEGPHETIKLLNELFLS